MNRSISLQPEDVHVLLAAQLALVVVAVAVFYGIGGWTDAKAALYGGACALLVTWMLGRRVRLATEVAREAPGGETAVLYIGAVQRFTTLLVLFGLGMGVLGLSPLPLLAGFAAAQVGYVISGARIRARADRHTERMG